LFKAQIAVGDAVYSGGDQPSNHDEFVYGGGSWRLIGAGGLGSTFFVLCSI